MLKFFEKLNLIFVMIVIVPFIFLIFYIGTALNCIQNNNIFSRFSYGYYTCVTTEIKNVPIVKPIDEPKYYVGDVDSPPDMQSLHYKSSAGIEEIRTKMAEDLSKYGYSHLLIQEDESNRGYINVDLIFSKHLRFEKYNFNGEMFTDEIVNRISASIQGSENHKVLLIRTEHYYIKDKKYTAKYYNFSK